MITPVGFRGIESAKIKSKVGKKACGPASEVLPRMSKGVLRKLEDGMETICCSCNRIKLGEIWKKQLPGDRHKDQTHGYCPKCFAKMMKKIDSRFERQEIAAA
ncbi:MAG: hypothetical protein KKG47_13810 [Proteobacteria bacterium]|nr:hypothetical protein [Pseudomonadota bacterium]MBU1739085.1 hypothetical protein [Pseudomonadota bacterium]